MSCQDTTLSLGVYLLGSLDPAERAAVESHLTTCPLCRAELDELAGLPSLLERISLDDLAPEPVPLSDDLYERVAARARAEHIDNQAPQRARYRRLAAVAAAVVFVTGGGIGAWAIFRGPEHYRTPANGRVQMDVTLASQTTGTGLAVKVSGLPTDEHCKLIAVAKDGSQDVAGRWDATYQGQANVTGSTSIPRSELSKLVLFGTDGQRLAVVDV